MLRIFDITADGVRTAWGAGHGQVPLGITTYAPNAIERQWRTTKGVLCDGRVRNSVPDIIMGMANQLRVRIEGGAYDTCVTQLKEAPRYMREGATRDRRAKEKGLSSEEDVNHRCVNLPIILRHYHERGQDGTYLERACHYVLATAEVAKKIYVMPKYCLEWATEKAGDMHAALLLGLAETKDDVRNACRDRDTKLYNPQRHKWLRQNFVNIYVTAAGNVVETSTHAVKGAGFTEHILFIEGLQKKDWAEPMPKGPADRTKSASSSNPLLPLRGGVLSLPSHPPPGSERGMGEGRLKMAPRGLLYLKMTSKIASDIHDGLRLPPSCLREARRLLPDGLNWPRSAPRGPEDVVLSALQGQGY